MATHRLRKLRKVASAAVRRRAAPRVLRYAALWEAAVRAEYTHVLAAVLPRLKEALVRQGARRDAVDGDELLRGLSEVGGPREPLLRRLFNQVDDEGERKLRQRLPGVALPDVLRGGPRLEAQWVRQNVDLINVPNRIKSVLRKELAGPLEAGVRVEDLMAHLQERFDIDARRAELIARDQTLKLSGQLQEERQTQAGIKRYVWTTSGDERVRHDHADLDGKVFSWDDPPIVNASEVARGKPPRREHPGGDFQCRCNSDPVLDDLSDLSEIEPAPEDRPEPGFLPEPIFAPEPQAFDRPAPAPRAPELPLDVPDARQLATPQQLFARAEEFTAGRGQRTVARAQAETAIAQALPGKSLEALRAIPFTPSELQTDTSLAFLRADPVFAATGNVADNFGRSKGGLPQLTIEANGAVYLSNGRHRLTVARELDLRQIVARIRKLGPRGGVLWDFTGPLRV